jgi:sugar phosphate isomerase/epimerase
MGMKKRPKCPVLLVDFALVLVLAPARARTVIAGVHPAKGFSVGCQANTFNRFTVFEAIEKTAQAGGRIIEFYPDQKLSKEEPDVLWNHNAPDEVVAKVKRKLAQHDVLAVGYGVVNIPKDEPQARRVFEFAVKLGLRALITESVEAIDTLEKLARVYDVGVAYHHHPRRLNDSGYRLWDPGYLADLVKGRDRRIGACVDTGNWTRSGIRPVDGIKILKGRILCVHMKDMTEFGKRDAHEVPFGTGASEIRACLEELAAQGFEGDIAVEYEFNPENNLPEVVTCIQFLKGFTGAHHPPSCDTSK